MLTRLLITACCLLPAAVSAAPTATELLGMLDWTPEKLASAKDEELAALAVRLKRLTDYELQQLATDEAVIMTSYRGNSSEVIWRSDGALRYATLKLKDESGEQFEVIASEVPQQWRRHSLGPNDTVVLVGLSARDNPNKIITPRVEWRPHQYAPPVVNYGETLIASLGLDVAALEAPVNRRPLERIDRASFYILLSAMKAQETKQLAELAQRRVKEFAREFTGSSAPPERRRLTKLVDAAASEGAYSVAPLFLAPQDLRGELFTFDALLRRAVRIEVAPAADTHDVTHYYELEVYPADSQNLPLVFCVPELPAGFPTGDDIAQPARLAGFFYKQWRYTPRRSPTDDQTRQFAPLLIGPKPQILETPTPAMSPLTPVIAGGMVVCLALLAAFLWRTHREDR